MTPTYGIRVNWASVAHPRTNAKWNVPTAWSSRVPTVLWSLRTNPNRSTGFTTFFLVYGAEAVFPTDLEYGAPRVKAYDEAKVEEDRQDTLNQLDKACSVAHLRSTKYQQALRRYHSKTV